jgi:hypothetical protein
MKISPFQYGKIVTGLSFVNRSREKELLIRHFQSGQNSILISEHCTISRKPFY